MAKAFTDKEAREIMLSAGFRPLVPYEKSSIPWKSKCLKCKKEVSPSLNNVKSKGVSCSFCSGNAVDAQDALKLLKKMLLKPLVDFPGAKKPWKCECLVCGGIVSPTFSSLKNGGGCRFCARKKVANFMRTSDEVAVDIMKDAGLLPLEAFSGAGVPWKSRCLKCKRIVFPRLSAVKSKGSGCAYCSKRRIDPSEAEKLFKSVGLKPLIAFPGNKKPWTSIHRKCGKEVAPTYQAIADKGQGPCKFCAKVAVHPKDAELLFLSNGLKPLVPYPGDSKKPWLSIHLECGREVSPTYNIIQRQESIGCPHCSDQFVDPAEAFQFFTSKDLQPLVPYPGSNKPWKSVHTICGEIIQPRYGHIKSGRRGCPVCAGVVPITQERAFAFFKSHGLEPQEPFQGPHHPWKSIHIVCGRRVSPRWASVQQGQNGCKYCAGAAVEPTEALQLFQLNELEPKEPFPGAGKPWLSLHKKCGRLVSPRYSGLRSGQGPCRYCAGRFVDPSEALQLFRSRGLLPQTPYPGASTGWTSIHTICGKQVSPTYGYVKMGGVGCNYCAGLEPISATDAKKLFISRGFKPIDKYVNSKTPIRAIHKVCGKEVSPLYSSIRNGGGCKYCAVGGINLTQPGFIYLMTHSGLGAYKIGIGGLTASNNRIEQHKKHGWDLYKKKDFATSEIAYEVEQEVLFWLRNELGLPQYLALEQMPQGGHTETVDSAEIDLLTIWSKVVEVSKNAKSKLI